MNQKNLSLWLKIIVIAMMAVGLALYFVFVPFILYQAVKGGMLLAAEAWAWIGFLLASAIPCYIVLCLSWQIAYDISRNEIFTQTNSQRLKKIMICCLADTAYLFIGNLLFYLLSASTTAIFISFTFIDFAGAVLAVAAGCLSHLVYKAAMIREENEGFV